MIKGDPRITTGEVILLAVLNLAEMLDARTGEVEQRSE